MPAADPVLPFPSPDADPRLPSRSGDVSMVLEKLSALTAGMGPTDIVYFVHSGDPVSKARARWSRKSKRFYTPVRTEHAEGAMVQSWRSALRGKQFTGNVAIVGVFFRPNHQRIDGDNLMKLVLDSGTHAKAWQDDCQVTAQATFIELDAEKPRTLVAICQALSTLDRERMVSYTCQRCAVVFQRDRFKDGSRHHRFCSLKCAQASGLKTARCRTCDQVFQRMTARQVVCSRACAVETLRRVRQAINAQRPWPRCGCGRRVSRREYLQCSACAPKGRRLGSKNKRHRSAEEPRGQENQQAHDNEGTQDRTENRQARRG